MHIDPALEGGYVHDQHYSWPPYTNNYPGSYTLPNDPGVTGDFHTYGVRWSPNNVVWYVDGSPVYQQPGHAPPKDMHVIANLAIAPWPPFPFATDFPASYEIDYIRVFRSLENEMLFHWGNDGHAIHWWNLNPGDQFVAGDFDGDGHDELLAVSAATGFAHLMKYGAAGWNTPWANNGSHVIHWWNLNPGDQLVAGDFDGDGHDELLAVSAATGFAHLMKYGAAGWNTPWANNGSHVIHWWNLNPGDQLVAGDFDGDGHDELLAVSAATGFAHLMKYGAAGWNTPWANNGSHVIHWWNLNPGDQLVAGDFDGDGHDELLAVSAATGFAHLMKYGSADWSTPWANNGSHAIHWWNLNPGDQLVASDFDGDGHDELLAVSMAGWSHLMKYGASTWSMPWSNEGARTIHLWHMKSSDRYLTGEFDPQSPGAKLLAHSQNGWAHVIGYDPLPIH